VTGDILLYWGPWKHVTEDGICTVPNERGKTKQEDGEKSQ